MSSPAVDVVGVVRATLKAYLEAEFPLRLTSAPVVVFDDFPAPGVELPERAVSIALPDAGEVLTRYWPPEPFELTPDAPGSLTGRVVYSFGEFELPVQVDVWTRYRTHQREVVEALRGATHRHPNETLAFDSWPRLGAWPEVVLPPPVELPGVYLYVRLPEINPPAVSGGSTQEGEFRVIIPGVVQGYLTSEEAVSILREFTLDQGGGDTSTLTI